MNTTTPLWKALAALVERESFWLRRQASLLCKRRVAIFSAGATAQSFYNTLLADWGIEAEFFIDNNPDLENKLIHNKAVRRDPWVKIPDFCDEYAVIVATSGEYYKQIAAQLDEIGLTAYMHYDAFVACSLYEQYKSITELLEDDLSKASYLAAIYSLLTGDNRFIQFRGDPYFDVKGFIRNGAEIIVDAGAFVGDTVEEYFRRGITGLKIYAFEPSSNVIAALKARVSRLIVEWALKEDDIVIVSAGIGAKTEIVRLSLGVDSMLRKTAPGINSEYQVYSLDDYFADKKAFTLLKSDIEGMELELIKGAKGIIRNSKPKMALSIYHSPHDFFQIPEYIKSLVPQYKMWVRNHDSDSQDTILYCMVEGGLRDEIK
ncbi:hypothetical protein AGMMS50276_30000 [Synergistales bacterium]|nr:hypothetical protein AGMMS50276_30000 [Synergistales bacterium]